MSELRRHSVARLTTQQVAEALHLARNTHLPYIGKPGVYGHNSLRMHEVGKLGEFGVSDWFEVRGYDVRRRFVGMNNDADVIAIRRQGELRVEVKTWTSSSWERNGRMLAGKQLVSVAAKSDVIVWCRVDDSLRSHEVILEGWSDLADVICHGQPLWWPTYLPQLQISDEFVRPMHELADPDIDWKPMPSSVRPVPPGCTHHRLFDICWGCVPVRDPDSPELVRIAAGRNYFHHGDTETLKERHGYWPFGDLPERLPLHEAALRRGVRPCPRCFPDTDI